MPKVKAILRPCKRLPSNAFKICSSFFDPKSRRGLTCGNRLDARLGWRFVQLSISFGGTPSCAQYGTCTPTKNKSNCGLQEAQWTMSPAPHYRLQAGSRYWCMPQMLILIWISALRVTTTNSAVSFSRLPRVGAIMSTLIEPPPLQVRVD